MSKQQNNNNHIPARPPVELIDLFLKNQAKELDLRARELELHKQSDSHSFQYAQAALSAEATDRQAVRVHALENRRVVLRFILILVLVVVSFLGYALYTGKDAIAMEVIKAIIFLLSGGGGGYAIGKSRRVESTLAQKDEEHQ